MNDIVPAQRSLVDNRITAPGLYLEIPERIYHADPCPSPSLSSSVAKALVSKSPGHAWELHPKLNRARALELERSTRAQVLGTAVHKLILGKGRPLKVLNFDDYKTNAAKAARDKAIAAGETPLLDKEINKAEEIAEAAKRRIAKSPVAHLIGADKGDAEVTGAWQERNGIWCRMRLDWLPTIAREGGHITVLDLKTTGQSAKAEDWQRTMFDFGGDIQSDFYKRGLRKLIPGVRSVDFVFVVIEQDPPYAVELCRCSGETSEHARESVELAIRAWGECLQRGTDAESWPLYEGEIVDIDPPAWRSMAGEMSRMRLANRIAAWQRPLNPDKSEAA